MSMAYALDLLAKLLVLSGFVVGGVRLYHQFVLNRLWREEKQLKWWEPARHPLLRFDLPEGCRPQRRKLVLSLAASLAVWLLLSGVIALNYALGIYPMTVAP
jgi:hypothetical protein